MLSIAVVQHTTIVLRCERGRATAQVAFAQGDGEYTRNAFSGAGFSIASSKEDVVSSHAKRLRNRR